LLRGASGFIQSYTPIYIFISFIGLIGILASVSLWGGKYFGLFCASSLLIFQIIVDAFKLVYSHLYGNPNLHERIPEYVPVVIYIVWTSILLIMLWSLTRSKALCYFGVNANSTVKFFAKIFLSGLGVFGTHMAIVYLQAG
jgi:hypothetical protein